MIWNLKITLIEGIKVQPRKAKAQKRESNVSQTLPTVNWKKMFYFNILFSLAEL